MYYESPEQETISFTCKALERMWGTALRTERAPTFFAQHAIAQHNLSELEFILQELAQGSACVHRKALGSKIQAASSCGFLQVLQNTLLRLGATLLAQPRVGLLEVFHL